MNEPDPDFPDPLPERPDRIRMDDPLAPRSPWSFWREALPGGFSKWGLHLMSGWVCFAGLGSAAWALHLRSFVLSERLQEGGSGLPAHWGELLTARDLWELGENGGWKHAPFGTAAPFLGFLALVWVLWAGWRMQSERAGVPGRLGPWILGLLEALLIGLIPIGLAGGLLLWILGKLGGSGFSGLGWLNLIGGGLLRLALPSALMLQWWFCRLGRAGAPPGPFMGSFRIWGRHLGQAFLRLWMHPVHWGSMLYGGTALRTGATSLALFAGWRLGGASAGRTWLFFLLVIAAAGAGAWLMGWFLRVAALFWAQDERVQAARREIEQRIPEDADAVPEG